MTRHFFSDSNLTLHWITAQYRRTASDFPPIGAELQFCCQMVYREVTCFTQYLFTKFVWVYKREERSKSTNRILFRQTRYRLTGCFRLPCKIDIETQSLHV